MTNTENRPAALDTLNLCALERAELARREFAAALDARLDGATWEQIGTALGITKQAAQQRFHGSERSAR